MTHVDLLRVAVRYVKNTHPFVIATATGYVGKHVIAYAQVYPTNSQIPWLLHVVVVSTRGGCVDKNNREISQQAYTLLHRKYHTSEWAKKTPYWY